MSTATTSSGTPGAMLKEWRHRHQWTRKTLAALLGYSPRTIRAYENGERRIPLLRREELMGIILEAHLQEQSLTQRLCAALAS